MNRFTSKPNYIFFKVVANICIAEDNVAINLRYVSALKRIIYQNTLNLYGNQIRFSQRLQTMTNSQTCLYSTVLERDPILLWSINFRWFTILNHNYVIHSVYIEMCIQWNPLLLHIILSYFHLFQFLMPMTHCIFSIHLRMLYVSLQLV